jgi:predicted AlkP superfamily phosphohydrolase/phosphomutase/tetratricopeptide (TPR) repeat protein
MQRILAWTALLVMLAGAAGCSRCDTDPGQAPEAPSRSLEEFEPLGKVFILGLDGADWRIIDRLEEQGRLPNLARLRREGAWGLLRSEQPLLSPIVWTTIAAGRHPLDHGIMGFLTARDGKTEPVRSDERRVPAFWNLAGRLGFKVGVIGWYTSWPAEEVNGFLVSDRVGYHQVSGSSERASAGLAYPQSLYGEIEPVWRQIEENMDGQAAARFFRGERGARIPIEQERLDTFIGVLRTTELYRALAPHLMERYEPDLMAVYFEGTDSVGHLFAEFAAPALPGVDARAADHLGAAFDRFYEYIDTVVGELVSRLDAERTTLIIISDHGFKSGEARPKVPSKTAHGDQAPLWHRPEGILLMWGRGVQGGVELPESSIFDVLPTALRALGAPLAENLRGKTVDEAFTPEILARAVRTVEDYGPPEATTDTADLELPSEEVIAKLQALGYVGSPGASPQVEIGAAEEGQSSIPLNRFNLGVVLLNDGSREQALELFRSLQRERPEFALGFYGEGLVLIQGSRFEEAARVLERAVALGAEFPAIHAALGEAYLGLNRVEEAAAALRRALDLDAGDGRTALLLGQLEIGSRDLERAAAHFATASRLAESPMDRAAAHVGLAIVAEERQDLEEAAEQYERALRTLPGFPRALERYGNLELYRNRLDHALELFSRLVEVTDESEQSLALYGRALQIAGREAESP